MLKLSLTWCIYRGKCNEVLTSPTLLQGTGADAESFQTLCKSTHYDEIKPNPDPMEISWNFVTVSSIVHTTLWELLKSLKKQRRAAEGRKLSVLCPTPSKGNSQKWNEIWTLSRT